MRRSLAILVCLVAGALSPRAHAAVSLPKPVTSSIVPLWMRYPVAKGLAEAVAAGKQVRAVKDARALLKRPQTPLAVQTYARWVVLKSAKARGDRRLWRATLEALARQGPLRQQATRQLIETELRRGRISVALKLMNTIEASHPDYAQSQLRRLRLAIDIGNLRVAKQAMEQLNPSALPANKLACYWFHVGELHRLNERLGQALRAYQNAWKRHHRRWSGPAAQRMLSLGRSTTRVQQVHQLLAQRPRGYRARRKGVRAAWKAQLEELASSDAGLWAYAQARVLQLRRATRKQALVSYRVAIETASDVSLLGHARYHLADLLGRLNKDHEAIAILEPALDLAMDIDWLARARYRLHRLYKAVGRSLDAQRQLQWIVSSPCRSKEFVSALWALAWRRFTMGDYFGADRLFVRIESYVATGATYTRQPWAARLGYWRARVAQLTGQSKLAQRRFDQIRNQWPLSWYGLLADDRLSECFESEATAHASTSLQWPSAIRGAIFYLSIGQLKEATEVLESLRGRGLSRGGVQLLAAVYERRGLRHRAVHLLRRFVQASQLPEHHLHQSWKEVYPIPWRKLFRKSAARARIPQALLYAVARQESSFVAHAVSGAGAVGLTQLLPSVARTIARLYQRRRPSRRGLSKPSVNVALGALYLSELSSMFHRNCALVTAAYNAGPYAVRRWLRRFGPVATDVFVESIPYRGAARYAMGVCAATATYAWIYPQWAERAEVTMARAPRVPAVSELGPFMTGLNRTSEFAKQGPLDRVVALR